MGCLGLGRESELKFVKIWKEVLSGSTRSTPSFYALAILPPSPQKGGITFYFIIWLIPILERGGPNRASVLTLVCF